MKDTTKVEQEQQQLAIGWPNAEQFISSIKQSVRYCIIQFSLANGDRSKM